MFSNRLIFVLVILLSISASAVAFEKQERKPMAEWPVDPFYHEGTQKRSFDTACEKKFIIRKFEDKYFGTFPDSCFSCEKLWLIIYELDTARNITAVANSIRMIADTARNLCCTELAIPEQWVTDRERHFRVAGYRNIMEINSKDDSLTTVRAQAGSAGKKAGKADKAREAHFTYILPFTDSLKVNTWLNGHIEEIKTRLDSLESDVDNNIERIDTLEKTTKQHGKSIDSIQGVIQGPKCQIHKVILEGLYGSIADFDIVDHQENNFVTEHDYQAAARIAGLLKSGFFGLKYSVFGGIQSQEFKVTNPVYPSEISAGKLKRDPWFIQPGLGLVFEFKREGSFLHFEFLYRYDQCDRESSLFEHKSEGLWEFKVLADETQEEFTLRARSVIRKSPLSDVFDAGFRYIHSQNQRETVFKQIIMNQDPIMTEHPEAETAATTIDQFGGHAAYTVSSALSGLKIGIDAGWETCDFEIARDPLAPPFENSIWFTFGIAAGVNSGVIEIGVHGTSRILDKTGWEIGSYLSLFGRLEAGLSYASLDFESKIQDTEFTFEHNNLEAYAKITAMHF